MSKNDEAASEKAQDEISDDAVYDFLYYDTRRIGSFLAQFDDSGHLQQVTQEETDRRGRTSSFSLRGAGTVKIDIPLTESGLDAEGEGNLGHERTNEGSESASRVYDPLWTNARAFLGFLKKRGLIQREIHSASVSQFIVAKGDLVVLDVALLKEVWKSLPLRKHILAEAKKAAYARSDDVGEANAQPPTPTLSRQQRRREGILIRKQKIDQLSSSDVMSDKMNFAIEMLSILPHSIQAHLIGPDFAVWCTLNEASLVGLSSDLSPVRA